MLSIVGIVFFKKNIIEIDIINIIKIIIKNQKRILIIFSPRCMLKAQVYMHAYLKMP